MAEANFIQDGIDRFQSAFDSLDREYRRLQKQADKRRRDFEKRAEKQVKRLRTEFTRNPVVQNVRDLRNDAQKRWESRIEGMLSSMHIATSSEIKRLDRKVNQLNRKVRELLEE